MRFASGFLAAIVLMVLVAFAVSYSGVVNVAATEQDKGVAAWFLSNTMLSSVRRQASGIAAPRQASEEEIRGGIPFLQRGLRLLPRRARQGPDRHRQGTQSRATLSA